MDPYATHHGETAARYATPCDTAADMLRAADLLFRSRPVYIIHRTDANFLKLPMEFLSAHGWTGNQLAIAARQYLESVGRYRGDGFAMILNIRNASMSNPQFVATVLHESAHWAEWSHTTAESHGPTFHRAALHLHRRASLWLLSRGCAVPSLSDVLCERQLPAPVERLETELAVELRDTSKPIVEQLQEPMPVAFWSLFQAKAERSSCTISRSPPAAQPSTGLLTK